MASGTKDVVEQVLLRRVLRVVDAYEYPPELRIKPSTDPQNKRMIVAGTVHVFPRVYGRCLATSKGAQCVAETSAHDYRLCDRHLGSIKHLAVAPSRHLIALGVSEDDDAVLGLYAVNGSHTRRDRRGVPILECSARPLFEVDDIIDWYGGENMTLDELNTRYKHGVHGPYVLQHDTKGGVTILNDAMGAITVASYANDARGSDNPEGNAHLRYDTRMHRFVLRALDDIYPGEEILTSYGTDYVWGASHPPNPMHPLHHNTCSERHASSSGRQHASDTRETKRPRVTSDVVVVRPLLRNVLWVDDGDVDRLDLRSAADEDPANEIIDVDDRLRSRRKFIRVYGSCIAQDDRGNTCRTETLDDYRFCAKHLAERKRLAIADSEYLRSRGIQGRHVRGLYAVTADGGASDLDGKNRTLLFAKGDNIDWYGGEIISQAELDRRYPGQTQAPYTWSSSPEDAPARRTRYIIDALCARNAAAYANDARTNVTGIKKNARLYYDANIDRVFLQATSDIRNGDEILVNYGDAYWEDTERVSKETHDDTLELAPGITLPLRRSVLEIDGRTLAQAMWLDSDDADVDSPGDATQHVPTSQDCGHSMVDTWNLTRDIRMLCKIATCDNCSLYAASVGGDEAYFVKISHDVVVRIKDRGTRLFPAAASALRREISVDAAARPSDRAPYLMHVRERFIAHSMGSGHAVAIMQPHESPRAGVLRCRSLRKVMSREMGGIAGDETPTAAWCKAVVFSLSVLRIFMDLEETYGLAPLAVDPDNLIVMNAKVRFERRNVPRTDVSETIACAWSLVIADLSSACALGDGAAAVRCSAAASVVRANPKIADYVRACEVVENILDRWGFRGAERSAMDSIMIPGLEIAEMVRRRAGPRRLSAALHALTEDECAARMRLMVDELSDVALKSGYFSKNALSCIRARGLLTPGK